MVTIPRKDPGIRIGDVFFNESGQCIAVMSRSDGTLDWSEPNKCLCGVGDIDWNDSGTVAVCTDDCGRQYNLRDQAQSPQKDGVVEADDTAVVGLTHPYKLDYTDL